MIHLFVTIALYCAVAGVASTVDVGWQDWQLWALVALMAGANANARIYAMRYPRLLIRPLL